MRRRALCVLLLVWGTLLPTRFSTASAWAQEIPCTATENTIEPRYIVLVHGINSSSQTGAVAGSLDPNNHQVRDDFRALRDTLATGMTPAPEFVYFSYGVVRELAQGNAPERGWDGMSFRAEREPRYWASDTTNYPIGEQAAALGWLVRELRRCAPDAIIDVVAYSTGGVVALSWVAAEADAADDPLAAIHRLVLLSTPVGGLNGALLARLAEIAPTEVHRLTGDGTAIQDLVSGSEGIRQLRSALGPVDVGFVENLRDQFINGVPLPAGLVSGVESWLGRGAALSFSLSADAPNAYFADMGDGGPANGPLLDYFLQGHSMVLRDPAALAFVLDLVRTDGALWQMQHP